MFEKYKQDNRIPLALMALMGLVFIVYLYDLITDFSIEQSLPLPAASHIEPIAQIEQLHVFGLYDNNLQNLPETQLQLTLQGVMLSMQNQVPSYAIVSSPSVPAKAYKIGDTLPGNATLKKVMKNEVVISYQGVLQSLKIPVDQLTFDGS